MDIFSQFHKVEYSNQIHQLLVTPSRHFSIDSQGKLIYQKELLKITLKHLRLVNAAASVVHYVLRDKFSGAFYSELFSGSELPPVDEFLLRAWTQKMGYRFGGLPEYLTVPRYADSASLSRFLQTMNVEQFNPTFSSEAGVRVIRIIETELIKNEGNSFADVQSSMSELLIELNKSKHPNQYLKTQKYEEKWISHIKTLRRPPEKNWCRTGPNVTHGALNRD